MGFLRALLAVLAPCVLQGKKINLRDAREDGEAETRAKADINSVSVFVAVPTRRGATERRDNLRSMWQHNADFAGTNAGGARLVYRFMLCNSSDGLAADIRSEYDDHKDLMLLDCEEGKYQGKLAIKTLHMMMAYWKLASNFDMFMKVDDTTFVDWRQLEQVLGQELPLKSAANMYVGVPFETSSPCRDYEHPKYEPFFGFSAETYPPGMAGGPGYLLGQALVRRIIEDDVASDMILWNEDRAVAVWVDYVRSQGQPVAFVEVSGGSKRMPSLYARDDSYSDWQASNWVVQHGLNAGSIRCLTEAVVGGDMDARADGCLAITDADPDEKCVNTLTRVETESGVLEVY